MVPTQTAHILVSYGSRSLLSLLRRRPMCRGDLQPSHIGELNLQATSLWELVHSLLLRCCHGHHPWIWSMLLRDRRGRGNEKWRRKNREHGEWGIDCMRSNKARVHGKERRQDNTQEWMKLFSLFQLKQMKEWRPKSTPLAFIQRPFEGRFCWDIELHSWYARVTIVHLCHRLVSCRCGWYTDHEQ